jgi:hypothetical protein
MTGTRITEPSVGRGIRVDASDVWTDHAGRDGKSQMWPPSLVFLSPGSGVVNR